MGGGQLADALEEAGQRRDDADVVLDRLDDDGRDLAPVAPEDGLQRLGIVERGDDRVRQPRARDAGRGRDRVRGVHRAHQGGRRHDADQDVVVVTVVPALELHDLVASGEAAGDPDGVHRDLGPRVAEANEVHAEATADLLGGDRGLLRPGR